MIYKNFIITFLIIVNLIYSSFCFDDLSNPDMRLTKLNELKMLISLVEDIPKNSNLRNLQFQYSYTENFQLQTNSTYADAIAKCYKNITLTTLGQMAKVIASSLMAGSYSNCTNNYNTTCMDSMLVDLNIQLNNCNSTQCTNIVQSIIAIINLNCSLSSSCLTAENNIFQNYNYTTEFINEHSCIYNVNLNNPAVLLAAGLSTNSNTNSQTAVSVVQNSTTSSSIILKFDILSLFMVMSLLSVLFI